MAFTDIDDALGNGHFMHNSLLQAELHSNKTKQNFAARN